MIVRIGLVASIILIGTLTSEFTTIDLAYWTGATALAFATAGFTLLSSGGQT